MDSTNGKLYPSRAAALLAGVAALDLVMLDGQPEAIGRIARKVRMASKREPAKAKALRRQQKESRRRNRRRS